MAGTFTIPSGGTISAGYTAISTGITIIDLGVLGSAPVSYGFLDAFSGASINNSGKVIANASSGVGVRFKAGGFVTNQSGASISGGKGVYITGGAGTVENTGSIGASVNAGGNFGVRLNLGGAVDNAIGGVISGAYGGVYIGGASGTAVNVGNVTAGVAGIFLRGGGTIINYSAITANYAVAIGGGTGRVTNIGLVNGTNLGVELSGGGSVTNSGVIKGALGVHVFGGAGSVANSGTINAGVSGQAVTFAAGFANQLEIYPGSTLIGTVNGGNAIGATSVSSLILGPGASPATITGIGSKYINFGRFVVAPGGAWTLAAGTTAGMGTIVAGATITDNGVVTNNGAVLSEVTVGSTAYLTNGSGATITGQSVGLFAAAGTPTVVNNGKLSASDASGEGLQLSGGGALTNNGSGTISGEYGVDLFGGGTVVNLGLIQGYLHGGGAGAIADAVNLGAGALLSNSGTITGKTGVIGVDPGVTVTNGNKITGTAGGNAVSLQAGGTVTNNPGASLSGKYGVFVTGGIGVVTNAATITGTGGTAVSLPSGYQNQVTIVPGATFVGTVNGGNALPLSGPPAVVSNLVLAAGTTTGTISSIGASIVNFGDYVVNSGASWVLAAGNNFRAYSILSDNGTLTNNANVGVMATLGSGAVLTNATGARIAAGNTAGYAVFANAGPATVTNYGSLQGSNFNANNDAGIKFLSGGAVTNAANAEILGASGVLIYGTTDGTVTNSGTIKSERYHYGVRLNHGGMVTNLGGIIYGYQGVRITGGAGTVVNNATISFDNTAGSEAVVLAAGFANTVAFSPAAVFKGPVDGGNAPGGAVVSTLQLNSGASAGTLSGIGTQYKNFGHIVVSPNATWSLKSGQTIAANETLSDDGTLTNNGTVLTSAQLVAGTTFAGNLTNAKGALISAATPVSAAYVSNGQAVTLTNAGTISGTATTQGAGAVSLAQAGVVTNQQSALIQGAQFGVRVGAVAGQSTVVNNGSILTNGSTILGQSTNYGAVQFEGAGGTLTNALGALISATSIGYGIFCDFHVNSYITNLGTIEGPAGIAGSHRFNLTNAGTGKISAVGKAIVASDDPTVTNQGLITSQSAVAVSVLGVGSDAFVQNLSGGTIRGANGVVLNAELSADGNFLTNAGLIAATGPSGYAVYFHSGVYNHLVDAPGATFIGAVNGGNTIGSANISTLELASGASAGTLTGLGSQFTNFASIAVDTGAQWVLAGQNSVAAGVLMNDSAAALTVGGVLTVDGSLSDHGFGPLIVAGGRMIVENKGSVFSTPAEQAGVVIGQAASGGGGEVDVTGTKASIVEVSFVVGDDAPGSLKIEAGGTVTTTPGAGLVIANTTSAAGSSVELSGAGSNLQITGALTVGNTGFGQLSLAGGGGATAASLDAGAGAGGTGVVDVVGTGSTLTVSGTLTVGDKGAGGLSILNGGQVTTVNVSIGASAGGQGNLVIGTSSILHTTGTVNVGFASSGVLEIQGGTLSLLNPIVTGAFGKVIQIGGLIDPPLTQDISKNFQFGGGGTFEVGATLTNSGSGPTEPLVSGGSETFDVPLFTHGAAKATGTLDIDVSGTLVLNVNTVDVSQTILFTDPSAQLVIGQQVTVNPADVNHTPTLLSASALGGFAGKIAGYATGNVIVVDTDNPAGFSYTAGGSVIAVQDLVSGLPIGTQEGILTFTDAASAAQAFADLTQPVPSLQDEVTPCFLEGTTIRTPEGPRPVESLSPGDEVVTLLGGSGRIVWTGHRTIDCARHPRPEAVWPIRIAAEAFDLGLPGRDLFLSPDHAVYWMDRLVPVKLLVNGATIRQVARRTVTYHHIELARHDVVLAEGLPAETYLDTGNRTMFEIDGQPLILHPDFATGQRGREMLSCAPFADQPDAVEPVWRVLAGRAEAMGWRLPGPLALTDEPDLHVVVGTRRVNPVVTGQGHYLFVVPSGDSPIRLVSRSARPNDARPWVSDDRRLGVSVSRIRVRHGSELVDQALDAPGFESGWWCVEGDNGRMWRWTNGDASLRLPSTGGARRVLELTICGGMTYPVREAAGRASDELVAVA